MYSKRIGLAVIILLFVVIITGCGQLSEEEKMDQLEVVTSFYPLYDFAGKIGGEHIKVSNLVPAGVEPHYWTPKSRDIIRIAGSDLFIHNGAGLEGWVDDVLDSLSAADRPNVAEAAHGISLISTEHEEVHEDEARHEEEEHHDDEEHVESHRHGAVDPHYWLSPQQAMIMASNIKEALINVDPTHQSAYEANYNDLVAQLDQLHYRMKTIVEQSPRQVLIVSHEALGYIARDYRIEQHSVMGLSPDAEPTVREMKEIAELAEQRGVQYILFAELVSSKLAETLAQSLDIETLVFHTLEGLTEEQLSAGEDYFSLMESNLTTLEKALQ